MNSFEPVFWMTCTLAVLLLLRGHSPRLWWLILGVSGGIGLLNKPSMAFFLATVALGLLFTPQRRVFRSPWAAVGVLLMLAIALPNVIWQAHHHWPTLEFLRNGQKGQKNVVLSPLQFFLAQFTAMQPINAFLWLPGIVSLLRGRSIRDARWLGFTYLFFFSLMLAMHAKDYYLAPIYPAFFAAGGVAWEMRFRQDRRVQQDRVVAFPVYALVLLITSLLILPMSSPVLRPADWVRYTTALHLHGAQTERLSTGPLPQFFADRFGWQEEVAIVQKTFRALPPGDQRRACIFGSNYGEAGAVDFLGHLSAQKDGPALPPAMSGHNNYWLWGTHGCTADLVIAIVPDAPEEVGQKYESVQVVGRLDNPWSMPYEHRRIYLLRGRRPSAPFHWGDERFYF